MEYYLSTEDYTSAIKMGVKIINKRKVTGSLDRKFIKRMGKLIETAYLQKMVQEMVFAQKEWENSRSFFKTNQIILDRIIPFLENKRNLLEPFLQKESNLWNQTYKLLSSMKPYAAETGYLENDFNPESGALSFGYSGGWALDYNLRSIGANLGSRKPVTAIRLRHGAKETRVRPDNLSLWISDDNKVYHRYAGRVMFSSETQAISLEHLDFACQYLKIHCDFKDDKYTFAETFKTMLETYGPPDFN